MTKRFDSSGPDPKAHTPAPVDLAQLARQTAGDQALEREVLTLFLSKSLADLATLRAASHRKERREAAHAIVGSARAIGAERLARLAAGVEAGTGDPAAALAELEAALAEARSFLSDYLAGRESVRA